MAIINCPECGKKVSTRAEECPHCGYPFDNLEPQSISEDKKNNSYVFLKKFFISLGALLIVGSIICIITENNNDIVKIPTQEYAKLSDEKLKNLAAKDDTNAMMQLGRNAAANSNGKEAFEWYSKAALSGNAEGQFIIGFSYYNGHFLEQDAKKAFEWFSKSANQGNADAQWMLSCIYFDGQGVSENTDEALKWLIKAAKNESSEAQAKLGAILLSGSYGMKKDVKEGAEWSKKSAENGDPMGQYNYGYCLITGTGVEENIDEGTKWIEASVNQGYEPAIERLKAARIDDDDKNDAELEPSQSTPSWLKGKWVYERIDETMVEIVYEIVEFKDDYYIFSEKTSSSGRAFEGTPIKFYIRDGIIYSKKDNSPIFKIDDDMTLTNYSNSSKHYTKYNR